MEILLDFEFMCLETEGKLACVTFTHERHLNAMSNACTIQINQIATALREDPNVR
jgi:enoyl-CoA hydratase/carnithine racemase